MTYSAATYGLKVMLIGQTGEGASYVHPILARANHESGPAILPRVLTRAEIVRRLVRSRIENKKYEPLQLFIV
jgi:hypothetical protein